MITFRKILIRNVKTHCQMCFTFGLIMAYNTPTYNVLQSLWHVHLSGKFQDEQPFLIINASDITRRLMKPLFSKLNHRLTISNKAFTLTKTPYAKSIPRSRENSIQLQV